MLVAGKVFESVCFKTTFRGDIQMPRKKSNLGQLTRNARSMRARRRCTLSGCRIQHTTGCASTGKLKICRIDKHVSSCMGDEEVFILVDKVEKKNVEVKLFEVNQDDQEIWCDYGTFSELDVHHQYAIVFRTPPYRDLEIEKPVDVFLQLYRPTDGDCSEPIRFRYKPSEKMAKKAVRCIEIKLEEENDPPEVKKGKMDDDDLLQKAIKQINMVLQEKLPTDITATKMEGIFNIRTTEGETALHAAVMSGDKDACKLMLQVLDRGQQKHLLNTKNLRSETPLHVAVLHKQPEVVKMLVTKGADPNVTNSDGNTAVHLAIKCSHNECLTELLDNNNYIHNDHKPKCNEKNDEGQTPLHVSAIKRNLYAIKRLVESGANVNERDSTLGRHVLMVAVEQSDKEIVEYLVKQTNVDVHLENYAGGTSLLYASVVNGGSPEICYLLMDAMADPMKANHEQRNEATEITLTFHKSQEVTIKEEMENEDEFQLQIGDKDENEEGNDDDDNDDGEENNFDGLSKGHTSMDFTEDNDKILEILRKADQDMASTLQMEALDEIQVKEECSSPSEHTTVAAPW